MGGENGDGKGRCCRELGGDYQADATGSLKPVRTGAVGRPGIKE